MKKSKLIMSVVTLCLALAVLCFGVYAVQTVNYSLSGNITYEVTDAFVEVQTKVYKSTNYLTSAQLGQKVNEIAETSFTTAPAGLTLVDTSAKANSTSGTLDPYSKTDLSFSTQAGSECYAYFFVTNIKNMSSEQNVWAVMQDDLTNPTNTVQINNGCQQTIDTNGKNMVIGVGLENPGNPIPSGTSSAFSYGMKIGVGDLATQEFNLAKLEINGSTVKANRSNMNGVVVIPDKNPTTNAAITTINGYSRPGGSTTAAFINTNFTTIAMADNIQTIGQYDTFKNNQLLTSVVLSKNLTSIGSSAFADCSKLSSITIPSSVTIIEDRVFDGCTGLQHTEGDLIYLKNTNSDGTVNKYFALYDTVNTTLTTCSINENCKIILCSAFSSCTRLNSLTIPNSVNFIGSYVFNDCTGLTSITIPNSVTYLGDLAFVGWTASQTIKVPFANAESRPSGWNSGWTNGCSAQIEYTPAA